MIEERIGSVYRTLKYTLENARKNSIISYYLNDLLHIFQMVSHKHVQVESGSGRIRN
jgi:hypothetical protein